MQLPTPEMLKRLGSGESINQIRASFDLSPSQFADWWQSVLKRCLPSTTGTRPAPVERSVTIDRDAFGIPHIFADNDRDLFFAFGYAQAQDRLWQLDYLRRRGSGRLAEVLGADGSDLDLLTRVPGFRSVFELDLLARTVGLRRTAEEEWKTLSPEVRGLLEAFSAGIDAVISESRDTLPIEFGLLGYAPEPWTPIDCLTIEGEFRWYLTGRFPVIVIPEMAKRALGDGALYRAFLHVEEDDACILPPGTYPATRRTSGGGAAGDPEGACGSNNWVVAGPLTQGGSPLVATDPHIAFDAVSCWYQAHLHGGSFDVVGTGYVGMPAIMFGRNQKVAWGCTNNICSQRDLYQEKIDPAHPGCFLHDSLWEPAAEREETIHIRGADPVRKTIRHSRNGPIVDEVLPPQARGTGPVSLRWHGSEQGGWLTALLGMNRARSAAEFRAAMEPWHVPTFSVVYADVEGHIGYLAAGRIPIREVWERGYRPGWDPAHQWQGLIPFEGMPQTFDPSRGWVATANNRPAPDDFPYPLAGVWNDGQRARRIHDMIAEAGSLTREKCVAMQLDALYVRGARYVPSLVGLLQTSGESRLAEAAGHLSEWDFQMEPDRVGATVFEVFFAHWVRAVASARFGADLAGFLSGGASGVASDLLLRDPAGWFAPGRREPAILEAMRSAILELESRLGSEMREWIWGRLHTLPLRHLLSGRGDLGKLLDHGGHPVPGNMYTVCNTGQGPNFESRTGAGYRHVADLGESPACLWAVDGQSQSGHPGSRHYGDQYDRWARGDYWRMGLGREALEGQPCDRLSLTPRTPPS